MISSAQGVICCIFTNGDPYETNFIQEMDALNEMMKDHNLPLDERYRVRDYFTKSKKLMRRRSHNELIQRTLSSHLTADVR